MLPFAMALLYALVLFAFASWAEGRSNAALKRRLRFPAYALGLAVYCTSWTFYGAVGSAVVNGWAYLPIYLGPILVFMFGHRFLAKLIIAFKTDGANSLSDFIGGRFGSSRGVATLVTMLALLGSIPYIALQLRSLSSTYAMISGEHPQGLTVALAAFGLAVFAMVYGTRRYDPASRNDAVLFAIGIESFLKLGALLIAGGLAIWLLQGLEWREAKASLDVLRTNFAPSNISTDFFVITFLSMAAIICLPRQFYVTVIEAESENEVIRARWPFILYMFLTLLVVLPISAAGIALLPGSVRPDLFVLQLPISTGSETIALVVFLGGFSAATAMVVVETIALATMVSNDLIAPALFRNPRFASRMDLSGLILNARRATIIAIMAVALVWALAIPENQQLASIGLVAFAAMAQFAPVLILAVYGGDRDAVAAKAGLSSGLIVWTYTLALPQVMPPAALAALSGTLIDPVALLGIDGLSPISHGTLWSIGANLAAYVAVTMRRVQTAAIPSLLRNVTPVPGSVETIGALKTVVARFIGSELAEEHFGSLDPRLKITGTVTRKAERLIASIVGLPSARAFLGSALHGSNLSHAEVASLLENSGQSLRFSKGLLAATLENIDPGVSVVDRELNIVAWNSRYLEMFDFPHGMVRVGMPVAELIRYNAERGEWAEGDVEVHVERRLEHMRRGQPHSFQRVRPDGRVLKTVGGPMPSGGYVMCFTDVTSEARALAEVEKARADLESRVEERTSELNAANFALATADAEKTRFLAAASHDLLQPLHAARLFSAALKREGSQTQLAMLRKLDGSIDSAESLLRALLDISKLDAGGVVPERTVVQLRPLLVEIAETMAPLAREKGIELRVVRGDAKVETDPGLLRSIIQNFLSNAVRYTEDGGILVGIRRRGTNARIDVIDTGSGIPEEKQAVIFREFERLPNSGDGGIGLGLAIVDRTARLLDARVSLRSRPGRGSRFSLSLPLSSLAIAEKRTELASPLQLVGTLSILVVDDDATNCEALRNYLEPLGHHVTSKIDGETALALDRSLDVALIDFNLGAGINGLELAERLLKSGKVNRAALVTAAQVREFENRAATLGVTILPKPVSLSDLDLWLSQNSRAQAAE